MYILYSESNITTCVRKRLLLIDTCRGCVAALLGESVYETPHHTIKPSN